MNIVCQICNQEFSNNLGGQLTNHIKEIHKISLEDYSIKFEYKNIEPKCICGLCDERPVFYRGKFKRYAFGHDSFEKRQELYILHFGKPKCKICGIEIGFKRAEPLKYCSFICQGKQNGFSKKETQIKIKEVVKEKYGVENISKLIEIREKISKANIGKTFSVSEETKQKHSINSKEKWQNKEFKKRTSEAIKLAVNKPEELQRRSEFAKIQMNNLEHIAKFFGSGFGSLSKVHSKIRDCLTLNKFGFKSEQIIFPYITDELNDEKKIVIEINGDYIHANPKKYKAEDVIRIPGESYTAQEKWEKDARKIQFLENKGYKVFVIWESDNLEYWKGVIDNLGDAI